MILGADLSDWQETVDFSALKSAGYEFAIAKATEGIGNTQETFARNRDTARGRGLVFGALHFFSWTDDPVAQASHFLSTYTPAKGDLPPTLDCEGDLPPEPSAAIAAMSPWLAYVEAHLEGGRRCLIYGSYSFFTDYLSGAGCFAGHPWWVAAWGSTPPTDLAAAKLWQSAEGAIAGVCDGTPPDLDQFLGTPKALKSFVLP